jgi:hypothetical protein
MKLFRGDYICNKLTEPGLYRSEGLRTKTFGKGDPVYIEKNGLLESLRQHIKPLNRSDIAYFNVTDFLSFTTERSRAEYWATNKNECTLAPCYNDYTETHYIFQIEIDQKKLIHQSPGVYLYCYHCNPELKRPNSSNPIEEAIISKVCPLCRGIEIVHSFFLIHSEEYLKNNSKDEKFEGALEYAIADNEWLVLPNDPLGNFRSARIPRAVFWKAEHYTVNGQERDSLKFSIPGICK